jgi:hypothetical protein
LAEIKPALKRALGIAALPVVAAAAPFYALAARTGVGVTLCRRLGFHPLPVHFYSPVPSYESVAAGHFREPRPCPGIDLDPPRLAAELRKLAQYATECEWPDASEGSGTYHTQNEMFGYSSAALLHCMLRAHATRRVIEVGGGYSSLISLAALHANSAQRGFTCVEPYPRPWLAPAISKAGGQLVRQPVQSLAPSFFDELEAGDLLFIDSSHVAKLASDVNFLFLEVLPRLRPGVLVHVHDIYIPYEYPAEHFFSGQKVFWNEQYVLQAMLSANPAYQVVLPGFFVQTELAAEFAAAFPRYQPEQHRRTSSFYIRKLH